MQNQLDTCKFKCSCGCELEYHKFDLGIEIYFWHNNKLLQNLITEPKIINGNWNNVIDFTNIKTWRELWNFINHNADTSPAIKHLLNEYKKFNIPDDAKLEIEFINCN